MTDVRLLGKIKVVFETNSLTVKKDNQDRTIVHFEGPPPRSLGPFVKVGFHSIADHVMNKLSPSVFVKF
jgi:hypothetical protein